MAFDFKGGKQAPNSNNTANSNEGYSSSLSSLSRPGGKSQSGGFKNTPTVIDNSDRTGGPLQPNLPAMNDRQRHRLSPQRTPTRMRGVRQPSNVQIPWRIVLPIIAIIAIIVLCIVFKDAITSFLAQVLTWVLIVLIIIAIIKWLIFPRRRR